MQWLKWDHRLSPTAKLINVFIILRKEGWGCLTYTSQLKTQTHTLYQHEFRQEEGHTQHPPRNYTKNDAYNLDNLLQKATVCVS